MNFGSWLCWKGKAVMSLPAGHLTSTGELPLLWVFATGLAALKESQDHTLRRPQRQSLCSLKQQNRLQVHTAVLPMGSHRCKCSLSPQVVKTQGLWGTTGCLDSSRTLPDGLVYETATLHAPAVGKDQKWHQCPVCSLGRECVYHQHHYTCCLMLREMQGRMVLDQCHLFVFLFEMNWENRLHCSPQGFLWIFVCE